MVDSNFDVPNLPNVPVPDLFCIIAKKNPERDFVQIIREYTNAPIDTICYTWTQVMQHVQEAAGVLRKRWGSSQMESCTKQRADQPREPGSPLTVVGIMAYNGYDLYVNILACLFNRWTVLLISPRNSPTGVEHLLIASAPSLLLLDVSNVGLGYKMKQNLPSLAVLSIVNVHALVNRATQPSFVPPNQEQLRKEMDLPAFYLHTSGSTGHPKIIPWTHKFLLSAARSFKNDMGVPCYFLAPVSHAMGLIGYCMMAAARGNIITFTSTPSFKPPTAEAFVRYLPFLKNGIVGVVPSILEELHGLGSDAVKALSNLRTIMYGGAPLRKDIGDSLAAAGLNLVCVYGSTELGVGSSSARSGFGADWEYVAFRDGYDWHFLPVDDYSNLRELVARPGFDGCPAVFNREVPREFATNDVWEPHPHIPDLWRFHSRVGDVTVLSNGEKTDNTQIEKLLLKDRRILYVQVFGAGRFMNGVVLQPADVSTSSADFLSQIQPTIEEANSVLPQHSRLISKLILVTTLDKSFSLTDKGTVKKQETLNKFQLEIEAAYESIEEGGVNEGNFTGNILDEDDVKSFVRSTVEKLVGSLSDGEDLFDHGFDSLSSLRLRTALLSVVKKTATNTQPLPRNIVYSHPTINALTAYLLSRSLASEHDIKNSTTERIQNFISEYSSNFIPHVPGSRLVHGKVIALSGSIGSVGSSMLALLLEQNDVEKIYLLNRKGHISQAARQANAFREREIDPIILEKKRGSLVYVDVDLAKSDLGVTKDIYEELRDNVTHIIHAAWHLNFNLILESYERMHIPGVRSLIDLALSSPHPQPPRITFLSTIGAAAHYQGPTRGPSAAEKVEEVFVPEEPIDDPSIPLDQGYGQGKYVCERILVNAVSAGLRTTIVRIGQLSGVTSNGAWASSEHIPILFKSSIALGMAPEGLPSVRWIPSDVAASAIIKQAFQDDSPLQYYSVENPTLTPWDIVIDALSAASLKPLKLVPMSQWLEHIRTTNPDPKTVPAVKLLDFYELLANRRECPLAVLGWEKSVRLAPELAEVGRLDAELVGKYVRWQTR